jgi:hypothetical protein
MSANCELIAAHKEHTESPRGVFASMGTWTGLFRESLSGSTVE